MTVFCTDVAMNVAVHQNSLAPIFTITAYLPELPPWISTHNKLASNTTGISALNITATATVSFVLRCYSYAATTSRSFGSGITGGMGADGYEADLVNKGAWI